MTKKTCKVKGCGARAWQAELCNLHALERYRSSHRRPTAERLAEGKRLLRQRAQELGIVLADESEGTPAQAAEAQTTPEREPVVVSRHTTSRIKVRSPVG